jgi:nucleoside-diphosphate-sugar epimerase
MTALDVVTGAFSFSGRAIAAELLAQGRSVRTLTGHPERAPAGSPIEARPLDFADEAALVEALAGATTLYNTYWIRFAHGQSDHDVAVRNLAVLFAAARRAGVERIVHISITNPSPDARDPYFRGKFAAEQALGESGVSAAVLRPAILFGDDGVLLNNIAWLLRRLPVFAVGGDGHYRVRPIHVDDLARLCVRLGAERGDEIVNAVGPDRPTFLELARAIRAAVGSRSPILRVPGVVIPALSWLLSRVVRDVLLTPEEYWSMAEGRADVDGPATGTTSVLDWIAANGDALGRAYANDLARHYR